MRLAPGPPACGPVPVVTLPTTMAAATSATSTRERPSARGVTATRPRPPAWSALSASTTATASRARPRSKWV